MSHLVRDLALGNISFDLESDRHRLPYQPIGYAVLLAWVMHFIVFVWLNSLQIKKTEPVFAEPSILIVQLGTDRAAVVAQ